MNDGHVDGNDGVSNDDDNDEDGIIIDIIFCDGAVGGIGVGDSVTAGGAS